jgi:hypothetical protein
MRLAEFLMKENVNLLAEFSHLTLLTIRKCEPIDGIVSSHIIDHQKM